MDNDVGPSSQEDAMKILQNLGGFCNNNLKNVFSDETDEYDDAFKNLSTSHYYELAGMGKILNNHASKFLIGCLNICSLYSKIDTHLRPTLIELEEKNIQFHALCLQECYMNETAEEESNDISLTGYKIDGYKLICQGKSCGEKGGLCIYLKNDFKYKILKNLSVQAEFWEAQFIEISHPLMENKLILGNIYRPGRDGNSDASFKAFSSAIEPILGKLDKKKCPIAIVGDYNTNLLKINEKTEVNNIFSQFCGYGYVPKITLPTRFATKSASLIDQIYVKQTLETSKSVSGILLNQISDHKLIFSQIDTMVPKQKFPSFILRRNITGNSIEYLKSDLKEKYQTFDPIFDINKHPEPSLKNLEDTIRELKDKHMPEEKMKFNRKKHTIQPYMTKDLMDGIRHRDRLYRRLERCKPGPRRALFKQEYDRFSDTLRKAIRAAKRDFYHDKFNELKHSFKKTWQSINFVLNRTRKKAEFPTSFLVNGQQVTDKTEIANKMNAFFTNIGPNLAKNIIHDNKPDFSSYLSQPSPSHFYIEYTDAEKIEAVILGLGNKDSEGIDGISSKFLKRICEPIAKPLSYIINQSLLSGIFPDRLKIAKVIPLYKDNDESENDFQNYRPISILTSLSKVFEKVMNLQLTQYLNVNGKFAPNQYGFRKNHSTELAATELIDRLTQDAMNQNNPFSIFIDLSKAFDTLDHEILLTKLQRLGICGNRLSWFRSYLTNRTQYVEMNGIVSETLPITTSVPQGSILGPTLFLIYINDINKATDFFKLICYADDTTLISSISAAEKQSGSKDIEVVSNFINKELEKITDWLDANKLSLNAGKTKFMMFKKKRGIIQQNSIPDIKLKGTKIKMVPEFDFLGFVISDDLTWNNHQAKVQKKISKVNGVLTKLRYSLPRHTLQTIYNSLIIPHLQYGITLWGSNITSELEKVQKQCIRKISMAKKWYAHCDPLFRKASLLKISDIHKLFCLKFYYMYENQTIGDYFLNDIFPRNSAFHRYETSTSNNFYVLTHHTQAVKQAIRYQVPNMLPDIPAEILTRIHTHSMQTFSKHLKLHLLSCYNVSCPIGAPGCFVCKIK